MYANRLRRHAQRVLTLAQGRSENMAAAPSIVRSWLRCLEQYRLDPGHPVTPSVLEHARLRERQESLQDMLEIAGGEMLRLHRQLNDRQAVLLSDAGGVVLRCVTGEADRQSFERAGLAPGAVWSEDCEGTNGIGTCAAERQPLTIHRDEHFRSLHTGLTCSASPVFDPQGELLAVLDVSALRERVSRQSQYHTMTLVNLTARVIESGYFLRLFQDQWLLRFQAQSEYLGPFSEGLLAFDGEGRVLAVNQCALSLLDEARAELLGQSLETIFDCRLDELFGRAGEQPGAGWPLRTRSGREFFALLRGRSRSRIAPIQRPSPTAVSGLCLGDAVLQRAFRQALRVFEHDVPLLLQGETGSGKDAFAKAVHQASSRAGRPFVALNCAAIPENLIESELFGYRGGSFTGARREGMSGRLQQANGGTLFLDEIGDMPLSLQTRLLRVLEERQVVPIGGAPQAVDVRVLSATHRDLRERVAAGLFREDLYYRLNGLSLALPPLRERADKAALIDQLLAEEAGGRPIRLEAAVRQVLLDYAWPGNVRQLRNVLRTLAALSEDGWVYLDDLPAELREAAEPSPPAIASGPPLQQAERDTLLAALQAQRWHVSRTAEQLGISRNTLYRKLQRHGISRTSG